MWVCSCLVVRLLLSSQLPSIQSRKVPRFLMGLSRSLFLFPSLAQEMSPFLIALASLLSFIVIISDVY